MISIKSPIGSQPSMALVDKVMCKEYYGVFLYSDNECKRCNIHFTASRTTAMKLLKTYWTDLTYTIWLFVFFRFALERLWLTKIFWSPVALPHMFGRWDNLRWIIFTEETYKDRFLYAWQSTWKKFYRINHP